jgi:hypothetical protein
VHWIFVDSDKRRFPRRLVLALGPFLLTVALNAGCQRFGWYERAEWADLDTLQRAVTVERSSRIAIVLISDADYGDIFGRKSPLEPAKVVDLVRAVCDFRPQAVGVDLVTSDWTAEQASYANQTLAGCPVVWIVDVLGPAISDESTPGASPILVGNVLGRPPPGDRSDGSAGTDPCWALSVLQPDADGVIRRYTTHYPAVSAGGLDVSLHRTFAWTLAGSQPSGSPCVNRAPSRNWYGEAEHEKKIPFWANGAFPRINAHLMLDSRTQSKLFETLQTGVFAGNPIVVVGGAYRQARDRHRTPIGMLYGSEILANAIYTEREGTAIRDVAPWTSILVDIAVGAPILWFITSMRLRWPWAVILSSVAAVAAAFGISYWLYRYLGYFLGIFGAMAGIVLGVVVEACWDPFMKWAKQLKIRINLLLDESL